MLFLRFVFCFSESGAKLGRDSRAELRERRANTKAVGKSEVRLWMQDVVCR
jgi:hypothetical protein